jgi:ATP-dependent Clp protease ATP-binding subunit ClpC
MEDELHKQGHRPGRGHQGAVPSHPAHPSRPKDPKRPAGRSSSPGPSGVGKTWLSKALAIFLFGDEDALIQLDMSEFSEKHTVSASSARLPATSATRRAAAHREGAAQAVLGGAVRRGREGAPDIFNSLLQILEEGRLTDSRAGHRLQEHRHHHDHQPRHRDIAKGVNLGFAQSGDVAGSYERMKARVSDELKQHFRPEFLNRVDEVIVFPPLTQDEIISMVDMMLTGVEERLKDKDMALELTQRAKELLARRGFDPVLGARPLRRTVQRDLEDVLAEKILYGDLKPGQIVLVDADADGMDAGFVFRGTPKAQLPDDLPPLDTELPDAPPVETAATE